MRPSVHRTSSAATSKTRCWSVGRSSTFVCMCWSPPIGRSGHISEYTVLVTSLATNSSPVPLTPRRLTTPPRRYMHGFARFCNVKYSSDIGEMDNHLETSDIDSDIMEDYTVQYKEKTVTIKRRLYHLYWLIAVHTLVFF